MIELSTIIALTVLFLHECTREGMVFGFVSVSFYDIPDFIKKPLFDCPVCMSPWWGMLIIGLCKASGYYPVHAFWQLMICVAMAGGINTVVLKFSGPVKKKCNCDRRQRLNLTDDDQ